MAESTAVATRQPTALEVELATYEPQFAAALPSHIPVDRFKRVVVTALNSSPDLARADRRSLFTACIRAAQDGLYPDGREAALVIFNSKDRKTGEWKKLVQYMPMVAGILKRLRNSGELASISANVVFSNDKFDYELGDNPRIEHKPCLGERGQPIGVYAIAKLTNGETQREVMSYGEVEKVRAVSRAKDEGPWVQWWEEMARKSVIRRLSKRLPGSSDLEELMRREEAGYSTVDVPVDRPRREAFVQPQIIEHESEPEPVEHDEETGEITGDPVAALIQIGNEKCEEGLESLRTWFRGLAPEQRGSLGAKGRSGGPYWKDWSVRAEAAGLRGGPAPDDDDEPSVPASAQRPEAEAAEPPTPPPEEPSRGDSSANGFGLPDNRTKGQIFADNVWAQLDVCKTTEAFESVLAMWQPQINNPQGPLSHAEYVALQSRIDTRKQDLAA